MPLDETLPTYYYRPDRAEPLRTEICFSQHSSPPEPKYSIQHYSQPRNNLYAFVVHDSAFPSVVFAELSAALEPLSPEQLKARRGSDAADSTPRFHIPRNVRLTLLNPDFHATLSHHSSTGPFSSPYWEFSLPKETFYEPTGSLIDADRPPKSDYAVFRWKKEGVISPLLRCTYCPTPIPGKGKRGADEPDITVAIFNGWESTAGKLSHSKGELTFFEPNQRRLEIQDWKGLEIALVASARAVVDIWFSKDIRETFRVNEAVLAPSIPAGRIPTQTPALQQSCQTHQNVQHGRSRPPPNGQRISHIPAVQAAPVPQQQRPLGPSKKPQSSNELARQEAEARRLQAKYEAEERARLKAIEKETERIRREYEKERQAFEKQQRKLAERRPSAQPAHVRPYVPAMPQRPTHHQTLSVPNSQATKKKSFWGLKAKGGGTGNTGSSVQGGYLSPPPPQPPTTNKLGKRKSFFW